LIEVQERELSKLISQNFPMPAGLCSRFPWMSVAFEGCKECNWVRQDLNETDFRCCFPIRPTWYFRFCGAGTRSASDELHLNWWNCQAWIRRRLYRAAGFRKFSKNSGESSVLFTRAFKHSQRQSWIWYYLIAQRRNYTCRMTRMRSSAGLFIISTWDIRWIILSLDLPWRWSPFAEDSLVGGVLEAGLLLNINLLWNKNSALLWFDKQACNVFAKQPYYQQWMPPRKTTAINEAQPEPCGPGNRRSQNGWRG
jgi:hypothetical protein